jgi:hypothetical protein
VIVGANDEIKNNFDNLKNDYVTRHQEKLSAEV